MEGNPRHVSDFNQIVGKRNLVIMFMYCNGFIACLVTPSSVSKSITAELKSTDSDLWGPCMEFAIVNMCQKHFCVSHAASVHCIKF